MSPLYVEQTLCLINGALGEAADAFRNKTQVELPALMDQLSQMQQFAYAVQDEMQAKQTARQMAEEEESDAVNHPDHYKVGGIETIDFIEAKQLSYHLGNVVKYVSRAGHKSDDALQDLRKAAWYLQREINNRNNQLELFENTDE